MERIRINTVGKIGIGAAVAIGLYETTVLILNKCYGVGLPYHPGQITPENALPAGALLGTYTISSTATVTLL